MSRFFKPLAIVLPAIGAVVGFGAGWPLWNAGAAVPRDSVAAWLWMIGGFVAFVGGVLLLLSGRSRAMAFIFTFAGFLLLFGAALYLPEARRAYDEWRGRQRIEQLKQPAAGHRRSSPLVRFARHRPGKANHTRPPRPVGRSDCTRTPLARHGCALRWAHFKTSCAG